MANFEDVKRVWLRKLDELEKSLEDANRPEHNSTGLMTQWGALMVEASQRAFVDQRFGDKDWPPRYPGMAPPFLNIAGSIQDFNAGRSAPKANRFKDRPALVDQGMAGGLMGSITFAAEKDSVEVGTNKPYAQLHQEGGESFLKVTEEGRRLGREWLFTKKGDPRKGREGYVKHLWPALFRGFLRQNVAPRPFLGVTPQLAEDLVRTTETYFEREQGK